MFQWLIVHTVVTAALAVLAATAGRCFRLGPAARHLLWLVVLVKLLTPPIVAWPWPLPRFGAEAAPPSPPAVPAAAQVQVIIIDQAPAVDAAPPALDSPPAELPVSAADAPQPMHWPSAPPPSWEWLPHAAAAAWLFGGLLVAFRNAVRILHWRRRLARGRPAPEWLTEKVRDLSASMALRPPRVVLLPAAASPMVWGLGAPCLIWPEGLEDRLSAEGVRAVLLHELAHVRRRDHWVGWLLLAGACVWWWHPLFWWVRRRLTQEAELACDAQVVAAAPEGRRAYAEALLEVSQRLSSTTAVPALGAASGRRDLERRLVMIMRGPAVRRLSWVGLAIVGVVGLLALPAWTLGEDPKPRPTPPAVAPLPTPASASNPFSSVGAAPAPAPIAAPGGVPRAEDALAGAPPTPAAAPAHDPERDRKIKELEDKVKDLLREIQQLSGQPYAWQSMNGTVTGTAPPAPGAPGSALQYFLRLSQPLTPPAAEVSPPPTLALETPAEVITLTRVSYKLKPATAEALASFLKDNVKTAILETKTEGETLVVTTTPEAQHAIGQFIGLLQGKTPAGVHAPGVEPNPALPGGLPPLER